MSLGSFRHDKHVIKIKFVNENTIKFTLLILMISSFLIPNIDFSYSIMSWTEIPIMNYIRLFVLIISCSYLPGSSILNLLNLRLETIKKYNINIKMFKITAYPLISFSTLGIVAMLFDFFNFSRSNIILSLICFVIILVLFDFFMQFLKRPRQKTNSSLTEMKISRTSIIFIIIIIAIIISSFQIFIASKYLLETDAMKSASYSYFVGSKSSESLFRVSSAFWGYITFSLSILCGIPAINLLAFLFIFSYLYVTTFYIFLKVILSDLGKKYVLLSIIIFLINSCLFLGFEINTGRFHTSPLAEYGYFYFTYKSFSFYSLFISLTLFIIGCRERKVDNNRKSNILLLFSAFFLLVSLMIYYLPIIPGILFIISYIISNKKLKRKFNILFTFFLFFSILFIILDILCYFCFSWYSIWWLMKFLGTGPIFESGSDFFRLANNALLFYLLLAIFLSFLKFFDILLRKRRKISTMIRNYYPQQKKRIFFIIVIILFSSLLFYIFYFQHYFLYSTLDINYIRSQNPIIHTTIQTYDMTFFNFYISYLISQIGIFGVLSLFLGYFSYNKNSSLFKTLTFWFIFLIINASLLLYRIWILNPSQLLIGFPPENLADSLYWFERNWFCLIVPTSILSAIGLIELVAWIQRLKSKVNVYFKLKQNKRRLLSFFNSFFLNLLFFFLIFTSFSRIAINGFYWYNVPWYIQDDEAQILGWTSKNIPSNSNILLTGKDDRNFQRYLNIIAFSNYYLLAEEIEKAKLNYQLQYENLYKWYAMINNNRDVSLLDEVDFRKNVILLNDTDDIGYSLIENLFPVPQTNGSLSFWIKTNTTGAGGLYLSIYGESINQRILFYMNYGNYYHYNDSGICYTNATYNANEWNFYRINFDCKLKYWNLFINGMQINNSQSGKFNLEFIGQPMSFSKIQINTDTTNKNYRVYLDAFNFTWSPATKENNFDEGIFTTNDILIPYLHLQNIQYFIVKREYESQYQELINNYFLIKLYEYGNFAIYTSNDI
ncbi:MAG: hypothetical protein ACFFDF_16970 [Candidatus Odinarchaeota archaeon]